MKKLNGSLFLKLLAFVMVCIMTPLLIGCCWFAAEAYEDGMYLTVWYFVDEYTMLHYISVEYYDSDIASYEMVRDTYNLA